MEPSDWFVPEPRNELASCGLIKSLEYVNTLRGILGEEPMSKEEYDRRVAEMIDGN